MHKTHLQLPCSINLHEFWLAMAGTYDGPSLQRICIANAIAVAIRKRWTLILPDLRFNYGNLSHLFGEPFEFMFDISALHLLSPHG